MPAPIVAAAGETLDSSTTQQVVSTDSVAVGDTLYIVYGSDSFTLAGMPDPTSTAGALTPVGSVDLGDNLGHIKAYTVVCTTVGVKTITFPAHGGGDIFGHWLRIGEEVALDVAAPAIDPTASSANHVAASVDPTNTDRLLVCTWLTTAGPAFVGEPYAPQVSMTKRCETGASPFSDMMTASEALSADTPTGTRTAVWTAARRYAALSMTLARVGVGGPGSVEVAVEIDATTSAIHDTAADLPVRVGLAGSGVNASLAPVSAVLCSSWANIADVPASVRAEVAQASDFEVQSALERASEILWMLSGRHWYGGGCTEEATLRSCPPQPGEGTWPYHRSWRRCACWAYGTWQGGLLWPAAGEVRVEHVGAPFAVRLPRYPVTSILAVTIDGDPFIDYTFTRAGWLERTDGRGWAVCEASTVISYAWGQAPPAGGRDAAVELGVELIKSKLGLDSCRLPLRTVSVTRQGVTQTIMDPAEFLDKGKVGLPGVDMWLAAVNPQATPQTSRVWSPDIPTTMRTV